jgi:hypothetical protein
MVKRGICNKSFIMWNLLILVAGLAVLALLYRWRGPILGAVRRFDARNAQRQADEFWSRFDPKAHYRQTLALAEEQVEEIATVKQADGKTGLVFPHYLFNGEIFANREDVEAARQAKIIETARVFYQELDAATLKAPYAARLTRSRP